jgi:hypothetical protein
MISYFIIFITYHLFLAGGFKPSEKYEFVNGVGIMVGIIPYMKWKIKTMFETTNQ